MYDIITFTYLYIQILRLNNLITYPSCRLASGEAPAPGRRDGA